jgi:hypothetical protein
MLAKVKVTSRLAQFTLLHDQQIWPETISRLPHPYSRYHGVSNLHVRLRRHNACADGLDSSMNKKQIRVSECRFVNHLAHWCLGLAIIVPPPAQASPQLKGNEALVLRVPCFSDQRHNFYLGLLNASFKATRHTLRLDCVYDLPGRRMWQLVEAGKLDLIWGMQSPDKDRHMSAVRINLTDGLAGQRVLLIRGQDQAIFDRVASLGDLRNTGFVAGFGEGWFDVTVWKANELAAYQMSNSFTLIYSMVAIGNRGIDYLPRGVHEISAEAKAHPQLKIEKNLLLHYNQDMRFYLSQQAARHRALLEGVLNAAVTSGLQARLIEQEFGADLASLRLSQRRKIRMELPLTGEAPPQRLDYRIMLEIETRFAYCTLWIWGRF